MQAITWKTLCCNDLNLYSLINKKKAPNPSVSLLQCQGELAARGSSATRMLAGVRAGQAWLELLLALVSCLTGGASPELYLLPKALFLC